MVVRIVVPCYNGQDFVADTLKSIKKVLDSFNSNSIDVIFVNDGSTDSTGDILEKLTYNISNFFVLHKENGGEGSARNFGLDHKGRGYDYVFFIDSDDLLLDNFILAYRYLKAKRPDMLIASYVQSEENSGKVIKKYSQREAKYSKLDALEQFMLRNLVPGIGNTFFRSSSVRFTDSKLAADSYFVFQNLLISNDIKGIGYYVYDYRIRNGSAMSSLSTDNILLARRIFNQVEGKYPSLKYAAHFFLLNETIGYYTRSNKFYDLDEKLYARRWFFEVSWKKQIKVILYFLKKWLNCSKS